MNIRILLMLIISVSYSYSAPVNNTQDTEVDIKFYSEEAYNKAIKNFFNAVKAGNTNKAIDVFNNFARESGMSEFSDMESFLNDGEQSMKSGLTGAGLINFETNLDLVKAKVGLPTLEVKMNGYFKNMIDHISKLYGYSKGYIGKTLPKTDLCKI